MEYRFVRVGQVGAELAIKDTDDGHMAVVPPKQAITGALIGLVKQAAIVLTVTIQYIVQTFGIFHSCSPFLSNLLLVKV
jgi:hypothetical protein